MSERINSFGINALAAAAVGCGALSGCGGSSESKTIDCLQNPGGQIEVRLDTSEVGDMASLGVRNFDTHEIKVYGDRGGAPNTLLAGATGTPLGLGGSKAEIDKYSPTGMPLFSNRPENDARPPYYTMVAIGETGSNMVTVRLTCDLDQTPPQPSSEPT